MEAAEPQESRPRARGKRFYRSFFTKKLERAFEAKDLEVPQRLLSIMDIPFANLTDEEREAYENEIKPLAFVFVEHLIDVYEVMGRPEKGWEEMLERLDDSPIKVLAMLVIHEDKNMQALPDDDGDGQVLEENPVVSTPQEKFSVRSYNDRAKERERWWGKKLF
jgi:hypothetical protein